MSGLTRDELSAAWYADRDAARAGAERPSVLALPQTFDRTTALKAIEAFIARENTMFEQRSGDAITLAVTNRRNVSPALADALTCRAWALRARVVFKRVSDPTATPFDSDVAEETRSLLRKEDPPFDSEDELNRLECDVIDKLEESREHRQRKRAEEEFARDLKFEWTYIARAPYLGPYRFTIDPEPEPPPLPAKQTTEQVVANSLAIKAGACGGKMLMGIDAAMSAEEDGLTVAVVGQGGTYSNLLEGEPVSIESVVAATKKAMAIRKELDRPFAPRMLAVSNPLDGEFPRTWRGR